MCVHLLQSRSRRRKRATALAANSSQDLNKTLPPLFTFEGGDRLALNLEHGYRLDLRRLGEEFHCGQLAMTVSRRKGAVKKDGGQEDHHNGNEMPSPQVTLQSPKDNFLLLFRLQLLSTLFIVVGSTTAIVIAATIAVAAIFSVVVAAVNACYIYSC